MDYIQFFLPPVAALGGVFMSEMFNRWKRREQLERILFRKKLNLYSRLVAASAKIPQEAVLAVEDKTISDSFPDKIVDEINSILERNLLLPSNEVIREIINIIKITKLYDLSLEEKIIEISVIHKRLCDRCRRELGLKALEKSIKKLS